MAPSRRHECRPGERGAITFVTVLLLAGIAAAAYLAVVWVPVYVVHYEAKQIVRDYGNQAVKDPDDARLVEAMCQKLRALDVDVVPGPDGAPERRPVADVIPQTVTWERDTTAAPPRLRVAFEYRRDVHYPYLDRWTEVLMTVDLTMDIERANWGPGR